MSSSSLVLPNREIIPSLAKSSLLRACLIWALAALFYFYDNLLQVSPSAMKPELSLVFVKDAEQFGSLSAYCLYAYGLMQIPAGLLMDRFGPRRLLTFACLFCGFGSIVFGITTSLLEAKLGRAMIGIGASFAVVGCLKVACHWFPTNRFAFMTGLTVTVGFLGAVFGLTTVSKIVETFGWRASMQWGGLCGILLSILLWSIVRDQINNNNIEQNEFKEIDHSPQSLFEVLQGLMQILQHRQTWIAALYAGLMFVPTLAFGGLWGIPFLVEAHGFDRTTAGMCVSLIYVGWMIGGPFWGFVSDYFSRRNLPMLVASFLTLILCIVIIYLENLPVLVLGGLLLGLGFFSSCFILAFAVVKEINSPKMAGTAMGFTNALNTLWGALAQPIIGAILDLSISRSSLMSVNGEKIFTLIEYQRALVILPIALLISICLLFFLKETFCQSINN